MLCINKKNEKNFSKYIMMLSVFLFIVLPKIVFGIDFSLAEIKTSIEVTPKNPGGYENVTMSISSPFIELDKAEITWSLDGKIAQKRIGAINLQFKTGSVGSTNKIGVVIKTLDGNAIYKDLIVAPSDVDLIWEAYTYTPPFYKGKALDTQESLVKIVAIPNMVDNKGNKLTAESLIYNWKRKGELRTEASGLGKNIFILRNDVILSSEIIELEVSSVDGTLVSNKEITLSTTNAKPIVYQNDPLLGVLFNRALSDITRMDKNEIRLSAYPFFFSVIKNKEEVNYHWKMNNKTLNINSNSVVFTKPTVSGSSKIELGAVGNFSAFQREIDSFFIDFIGE